MTRNQGKGKNHLCRFHVCRRENADGTIVDYATAAQKPAGSQIGCKSTATRRGHVAHKWSDMIPLEGAEDEAEEEDDQEVEEEDDNGDRDDDEKDPEDKDEADTRLSGD